jgi:hypothetical protein
MYQPIGGDHHAADVVGDGKRNSPRVMGHGGPPIVMDDQYEHPYEIAARSHADEFQIPPYCSCCGRCRLCACETRKGCVISATAVSLFVYAYYFALSFLHLGLIPNIIGLMAGLV